MTSCMHPASRATFRHVLHRSPLPSVPSLPLTPPKNNHHIPKTFKMSHMTDTSPWLHRYFLLALQPTPRPPSLNACYLQVITPVTPRRQLTVFDGAHTAAAVLSHSAANTLDADPDDLGVTTRNLRGYLIAPVSVLVVPDLWTAVPEAVLVLQAIRVFTDKCGGVPAGGRLKRVDFAPEVLRALRASVGRKMASFVTRETLEKGARKGEANVEKGLKEREEVRGMPPKGLEKEAKRLMSMEENRETNADGSVRGKSVVVDADLETVSCAGKSAEEGKNGEDGGAVEGIEDPDWNINFTQVGVDVGVDADAGIEDEALGESLPLTQHYSCNEEDMEEVDAELGTKGRVMTDVLSSRERRKRVLGSMIDAYWETLHDEQAALTGDVTKNIENIPTSDKRAATARHSATSDTPLPRVSAAPAKSSLNDLSQSAEMGKTLGTDRAESFEAKAPSRGDAAVAHGESSAVENIVVTRELSVREKKVVERKSTNTSHPETKSDVAVMKDEAAGQTDGNKNRKVVEINVESAVTRTNVQVSAGHVPEGQVVQSRGTKVQKETEKEIGTDVSDGKTASNNTPVNESTKLAVDNDTEMAETEPPVHDELDEITPVGKKKSANSTEGTKATEGDEIQPVVKAGSKRRGAEDGLDERNGKAQRDSAQEEKRDMAALQKLQNELELVRKFRKSVEDDPVGYIFMPDTFLPSLSGDKGREAKDGRSFPFPDLGGKGPEKPPQVLDVPESAPI